MLPRYRPISVSGLDISHIDDSVFDLVVALSCAANGTAIEARVKDVNSKVREMSAKESTLITKGLYSMACMLILRGIERRLQAEVKVVDQKTAWL